MPPRSEATRKTVAALLGALAGFGQVTQNGINSNLRINAIGSPFATAACSATLSFLCIWAGLFAVYGKAALDSIRGAPWWSYTGGLQGIAILTASNALVEPLGYAQFQLAQIAGVLIAGVTLDHTGALALGRRPATAPKLLALVALLVCAGASSDVATGAASIEGEQVPMLLLAAGAGMCISVQGAINSRLTKHVNVPLQATGVSMLGASSSLWLVYGLTVLGGEKPEFRSAKPWMWTGGLVGIVIVSCNALAMVTLGASAAVAVSLTAQLLTATVYDEFGAFNLERRAVSTRRALSVAGVLLCALAYQAANSVPVAVVEEGAGSVPPHGEEEAETPGVNAALDAIVDLGDNVLRKRPLASCGQRPRENSVDVEAVVVGAKSNPEGSARTS